MTDGQIQGQVVGVAMPEAGAQWIDHAEGRRPPAQPGPLGHQAQRHLPLAQAGDRQRPLAMGVGVVEAAPNRLGHQGAGGLLQGGRNAGQAGQGHRHQAEQQQGQQPAPAQGPRHQRHRQQQAAPGIAGIGEKDGGCQGGGDGQGREAAPGGLAPL